MPKSARPHPVHHGCGPRSRAGSRESPNLRGTLWSCNWYHQSTWDRIERSVETYGFPVAVSNGFGDNLGPSEMDAEQAQRALTLMQNLGDRSLELSWIEASDAGKTYNGRPVPEP